jgi:DNA-3-methyladenine glycosylase
MTSSRETTAGTQFAPLPRNFFNPSAAIVAPRLLGHILVRQTPEGTMTSLIVETEAYVIDDPACHGYGGESARNRSMYGPPGHAYVYFIYGVYWCVNAVCRPRGMAEAVLIRAVEPVAGIDLMRERRPVAHDKQLTNGPGKLCTALEIDRALDGADLCDAQSALWIARNPGHKKLLLDKGPMITTTRIGITKAAHLPLRFYLSGSAWVSRQVKSAKR